MHCIVPGGGLSFDQSRWVACRQSFFLPVRLLSRLFRRLFLDALKQAYDLRQLQFFGDIVGLADPVAFSRTIKASRRIDWVVYAKPPFCWTRAGAGLSPSLHASHCHLQFSPRQHRWRSRHIPMEGLSNGRQAEADDDRCP
jgi:hypothetical protein